MVGAFGDAGDEFQKRIVFLLKNFVEPFGDALHVKSGAGATGHIVQHECFFLGEREGDDFKFLDQRVAGLRLVKCVLAAGGRFARLAFHPLPDLRGLRGVGENNQVFMRGLGDLLLNFAANGVFRQTPARRRGATQSDHAALLGDGLKFLRLTVELDFERGVVSVPAEFFAEQRGKIKFLEELANAIDVEWHGKFSGRGIFRRGQTERADNSGFVRLFLLVDDAQAVVISQSHDEFGQLFVRNAGAKLAVQGVSRGLPEREAVDFLDGLGELRRVKQHAFDLFGVAFQAFVGAESRARGTPKLTTDSFFFGDDKLDAFSDER